MAPTIWQGTWEWVADWYDAKYYRRSPARNPQGPTSGTQVVLRGGSWLYTAPDFRTTERASSDRRNENIGSGVCRRHD